MNALSIIFFMLMCYFASFSFVNVFDIKRNVQSIAITESLDVIRLESQQRQLEDKLNGFGAGLIELKKEMK